MYEVKFTTVRGYGNGHTHVETITIASFDMKPGEFMLAGARRRAVAFAKAIDPGYAVSVVSVEDENNGPTFGLIYSRDAKLD